MRGLPALTVRLPVPVMARLIATGKVTGKSTSEIVARALTAAFADLGDDARTIGALARREAARLRQRYPEQG